MEFGFEPVCDQLRSRYEPDSVMEFALTNAEINYTILLYYIFLDICVKFHQFLLSRSSKKVVCKIKGVLFSPTVCCPILESPQSRPH